MRARPSMIPLAAAAGLMLATAAAAGTASPVQLLEVRPAQVAGHTSVLLEASAPVAYTSSQPDPFTVVLDLRHARASAAVNRFAAGTAGPIHAVDVEDAQAADGTAVARVRVGLAEPAMARVRSSRNTIMVEFPDLSAPAAGPGTAGTTGAARSGITELIAVSAEQTGATSRVRLRGSAPLAPRVHEAEDLPPRIVIDLPGVRPRVAASHTVGAADLSRIRVATNSTSPLVTRVVLDLKRKVPYRVESSADEVVLVVGAEAAAEPSAPIEAARPADNPAEDAEPLPTTRIDPEPEVRQQRDETVARSEPAPQPRADAAPKVEQTPAPQPARAGTAPAPPAQQPPAPRPYDNRPAPQPPAPPAREIATPVEPPMSPTAALATRGEATRQFTGHPISLDFQDVDLRSVLRTFGEITGLNLVIDQQVEGKVDVALRDVPWDQALDIILRANKLGYTVDGTIVRIAPLSVLSEEEAAMRQLAEEKAQSGELVVMTRSLNYAKASDIEPLAKTALTPRGRTAVDPRTNTLIIYDLPAAFPKVTSLIQTLDQPELQVEIEARIVQTTTRFARELGVKWGFIGNVAPELGNTTNLAFPNHGTLHGATGDTTGGTNGFADAVGNKPASTAVNLGVSNPTGAIGLTLGAINGAFRIGAELSALEAQGKVHSLLTPRVVTQNNVKAVITRGQEIPYSTITSTSSTGGSLLIPTVQFRQAALNLSVTPRITGANTVILEVDVDNGSPGEVQANGNIAINTQRAQTTVLVADGATTVIGGIQGSNDADTMRRVPGLWRLPWMGRLFRNDNRTEQTEEILIFITPRIIRMPTAGVPAMGAVAPSSLQ